VSFLKRLFGPKRPEELLERGDRLLEQGQCYEARCAFEEARTLCGGTGGDPDLLDACDQRIARANRGLAELNVTEALAAHARGLDAKAREHLELAKSLTTDAGVREKADALLRAVSEKDDDPAEVPAARSGCSSCSTAVPEAAAIHDDTGIDMPLPEYYDLLIHQLPAEMYDRYAELGQEFACYYVAESANRHEEALALLEAWHDGSCSDIYCYEKGMLLYRLGRGAEAEEMLSQAIRINRANSLARLGISMILLDTGRMTEALARLDEMCADGILVEQAQMVRADIFQLAGEHDRAIEVYAALLQYPGSARTAAARLFELLVRCNRSREAQEVHKRYLSGCAH
jgi:tetratricopeptide (TPR) repeat protein